MVEVTAVTVYLLNGTSREHRECEHLVHNGVLHIFKEKPMGFGGRSPVASYPLTAVERWEP